MSTITQVPSPRIRALEILGFEYRVVTLRNRTAWEILATDPHTQRHFSFSFVPNPDGTMISIGIYGASFPANSDEAHMALMARAEMFLRAYPAIRRVCQHCHGNGCVVDTNISGEIIDHANAYEQSLQGNLGPDGIATVQLPHDRGICTVRSFNRAKYMAAMYQAAIWSRSVAVREQGFVDVPHCVRIHIGRNCPGAPFNRFVIKRLGIGGRFPVESLMDMVPEQAAESAQEVAPPEPVVEPEAAEPAPEPVVDEQQGRALEPAAQEPAAQEQAVVDEQEGRAQEQAAQEPAAQEQPNPQPNPAHHWSCCECNVPFAWNWRETGHIPLTCANCGCNLCPLCLGILHATRVQNTPVGGNNVRWVSCPNPDCRKERGFDARDPQRNVTLIRLLDEQRP